MEKLQKKENVLKHKIKDLVFQEAFAAKENLPKIYKALNPEDSTEYQPNDFIITSMNTVVTNTVQNDISFWNLKTGIMVFIVAKSDWELSDLRKVQNNVIVVSADIAKAFETFRNADILSNEVFIFNTGNKELKKTNYHIFDVLNVEYQDGFHLGNLNATVISRKNGNIPLHTIIDTYFEFCEIQKQIVQKLGRNRKATQALIDTCIDKNIFRKFFEEHKEEVMNNVDSLFSQEQAYESFKKEQFEAGVKSKADKVFAKLLKSGMPEKEARELAYED